MNEINTAYLAWQAPDTREWHVVGALREEQGVYRFSYTRGAQVSAKFIPFSGMDSLTDTYVSPELFPLFKNRILSDRRPEYPQFIRWLGLDGENVTAIDLLTRSGGLRGTDQLQMFKRIEVQNSGQFEHHFFIHGLRHQTESAQQRANGLAAGDQLRLAMDCQNDHDANAVLIRADNPAEIIGYCPRYLACDISHLLKNDSSSIVVTVKMISEDAPDNYRVMCKLSGSLDTGSLAELMAQPEYQLIGTD